MPEDDPDTDLKREVWLAECAFRNREIAVKEAEQLTAEQDLAIRKDEAARSRWRSPLVVAILAAAVAATGNAVVAFVGGYQGQALEDRRAESTRILEMIKTGSPDKAAENLGFLVDAGLIEDPHRLDAIRHFLATRRPGAGPSLPNPASAALASDSETAAAIYKSITSSMAAQAEVRKKAQDDLKNLIIKNPGASTSAQQPHKPDEAFDQMDKYIRN